MGSGDLLRLAVTVMLLIHFLQVSETGADQVRQGASSQLIFKKSGPDSKFNEVILGNNRLKMKLWKQGLRGGSLKSLVYKRQGFETTHDEDIELLQIVNSSNKVHKDERPGYWDMHWYDEAPSSLARGPRVNQNKKCSFELASGEVLRKNLPNDDKMLGVGFIRDRDAKRSLPVSTHVHYSMRSDVSGVYCSLLVNHGVKDPAILLTELRLVLRLNPEYFDYSYVADDRQRFMPTLRDIDRHASSRLLFKEARLMTNPENSSIIGEVDHKYMHSVQTKDGAVYGWISSSLKVGVWIISPNKWEYLGGGPTKQELSIQTGPKILAMLHSRHYGTPALDLRSAEEWQKMYGPFLIYINEAADINDLIVDAKARAAAESMAWPYDWVPFVEYKSQADRGTVIGRVMMPPDIATTTISATEDDNVTGTMAPFPGKMWVGLIDASAQTSNWEDEVKNYQFWNTTEPDGEFTIFNVRPGTYVMHTIFHRILLDTSVLQTVTVKENWVSNVGEIELHAAQKGPIVWEIGYPDRSAGEFFIPQHFDTAKGKYTHTDSFRQYGLWEKYDELYPNKDPVFVIGENDWAKDWYFAHVLRSNNRTSQREISFTLDSPVAEGEYTLRVAIAAAHQAALEVRVNNPVGSPLYDTGAFGKDNALARGGIHGHYYEFSISLSHMNFRAGQNSIFLRQRKRDSLFNHVMYDYIRLEAPAKVRSY